jgi:hypothetical protein
LKFEDHSSKESMLAREKELLRMKENYEETMSALMQKKHTLEKLVKDKRDQTSQIQIDISRMQNVI